ncbi:lipopolysaccharide biosynthesis protein [Lichenifustis flavocetrariae]|uniref:Lipopolysaccharide biosynthesis protein n=1 Tax=Lichenifustis flavocetrariae TaxID=2949735 RepID=A0AA41YVS1_9HYPH|nr:lipopolysaccharide biosynthesis protein [Lichenifustis flavocetrariae]MCW6508032.1 lipopolysaccharide biosynthesis protein [Lichenifustis flavocetrariae]
MRAGAIGTRPGAMFVLLSFFSNTAFNFVIGLLLARFLGPDQYGRFALAVAIAVGVQTAAFDWARVAAVRFYSQRVADEEPKLRSTIDAALAAVVSVVVAGALLVVVSGVALPLSRLLIGLAVATAVVNGAFDYWTALIRARFLDRAYAQLILSKNLLSAVITLGGALYFGSAAMAMLGLCLSMVGGSFTIRRALWHRSGSVRLVDVKLVRTLLRYAVPVVMANILYQTIPLADRLLIAHAQGFAASGQFSLAYDIGARVISAVGSALDVLLFQIAVRADEMHGAPHARQQIGRNIGIVFAVLLPACVGLWLVMPSFEQVVVPPEFRGPFALYLRLLLPGLFCYGMIFFAVQPLFQIGKRTAPLIAVAAVASLANLMLPALLPGAADAAFYAKIQAGVLGLALVLLGTWAMAVGPVWPRRRDLVACLTATATMIVACRALPDGDPGAATLTFQVLAGVAAYLAVAYGTDLCGLRTQLRPRNLARHA